MHFTYPNINPEELRNAALGIAINQQADAVEFLDKDGYLVLSMRHKEGSTIEDYAYTTGGNNETFTNLEFVNKVLTNQEDQLGDKFSGYVEADWGNYFYVAGPVFDEANQFQGVIMVGTRLDKLVIRMHDQSARPGHRLYQIMAKYSPAVSPIPLTPWHQNCRCCFFIAG